MKENSSGPSASPQAAAIRFAGVLQSRSGSTSEPPRVIVGDSCEPARLQHELTEAPQSAALVVVRGPLTQLSTPLIDLLSLRSFCLVPAPHPAFAESSDFPRSDAPQNEIERIEMFSRADKKPIIKALESFILSRGLHTASTPSQTFARLSTVALEELLLNAIMANPQLKGRPRHSPFQLPPQSPIVVCWWQEDNGLQLSVEDPFGGLQASSALHSLCGHRDDRPGGVGLRFVYSRCHQLSFWVETGRRTRVNCLLGPDSHREMGAVSFVHTSTH